jgi:hypothetical protein
VVLAAHAVAALIVVATMWMAVKGDPVAEKRNVLHLRPGDPRAETADIVVCMPWDERGPKILPDNVRDICSRCGRTVQVRPESPVNPRRLCLDCAEVWIAREEKR